MAQNRKKAGMPVQYYMKKISTKSKEKKSSARPPKVTTQKLHQHEYKKGDILGLFKSSVASNEALANLLAPSQTSSPRSESDLVVQDKAKLEDEDTANLRRLAVGLKKAREVETKRRRERSGATSSAEHKKRRLDEEVPKGESRAMSPTNQRMHLDSSQVTGRGGARNLDEKSKKDENSRTVFAGNIPLAMDRNQLKSLLNLKSSAIQSIRFRSIPVDPTFSKNRSYAAANQKFTGTCDTKNAYIVLRSDTDLKSVLSKHGTSLANGSRLRLTPVAYNRADFSTFPRRSSLFLGNLHVNATEKELWDLFEERVGKVQNVRIIRDKQIYVSKGFGFIQLADRALVPKAIKLMHGVPIHDRPLNVTKALPENEAKDITTQRKQIVTNKIERKKFEKIETKLTKHKIKKSRRISKK